MNALEVVERIESIVDGQPELYELLDALETLQNELLDDESGAALEALRERRLAKYRATYKPCNNQLIAPDVLAKLCLQDLGNSMMAVRTMARDEFAMIYPRIDETVKDPKPKRFVR